MIYAKSATARPGDRLNGLNGFETGKTQLFNSWGVGKWAYFQKKWSVPLKNNKHKTYYRCTYLYIVNAVIFKLLLTSYLKRDLSKKNNNNVTTLICLAISVRVKVLRDPLVQYSRGLNWYSNIDELAVLARGGAVLKRHLSCSPITTHWDS